MPQPNRPVLFLRCTRGQSPGFLAIPPLADHAVVASQYDLPNLELDRFGAIVLSMLTDQHSLMAERDRLTAFLNGGGCVQINGHLAYPLFDGIGPYIPLPGRSVQDLQVHRLADHPIFDQVSEQDLTFRRGVAGFYGRGHHAPPPGAIILNGLGPERRPVDWLWQRPQGGTILLHAGIDPWIYAGDATSAARLPRQLFAWLAGLPADVFAGSFQMVPERKVC